MFLLYLSLMDDGERRLVECLYNEYKYAMFDAAYDILNDQHLAEDAIHTAFVNISNHLQKLRDVKCIRTKVYLLTAVKNTAKKMYNSRKPIYNYMDISENDCVAVDSRTPEKQLMGKLSQKLMEKCLIEMKPKYRDVLIMKYYLDKDDKSIAQALDITDSAMRKRLERARKEFISRYRGDDGEE